MKMYVLRRYVDGRLKGMAECGAEDLTETVAEMLNDITVTVEVTVIEREE
jgi:hypothetical protein